MRDDLIDGELYTSIAAHHKNRLIFMLSYEVLLDSFDFRFLEPCYQPYTVNIFVLLHSVSPLNSYLRFIPGVEGRVGGNDS